MSVVRQLTIDLRAQAPVWRIPPAMEERIVGAAPPGWTVSVVSTDTSSDGDGGRVPTAEAIAAVREAEVYFGFGAPAALLDAAPRLRWVHTATAGVGSTLQQRGLRERDILLTNSAGIHAVPMAEYVLGALLHYWRGFDVAGEQQRRSAWDRGFFLDAATPVREVGESTVLIVGAGGIGTAVATRLSALGATCVGVRRRQELGVPPGFARVLAPDGIDAELPAVDAVVLAAPSTEATRGMFSAARLDRLAPHAVVVNVGRGDAVDAAALAARLASGRLRGAALDVFEPEPLAPSSPLWQLRTAMVTPHVSAVTTRRFWERQVARFLSNWMHYVEGTPLSNVVDRDAGY